MIASHGWLVGLAAMSIATEGFAEEATTSSTATAALSAEELRAIQAAVQADSPPDSTPDPSASTASSLAEAAAALIDLSLIGDFALAAFSRDENLQGGGHDPVENGFNLQAVEMTLGGAVDPYFRFDANLAFSLFGVEIEEAYATALSLPFGLQARAGQFLTRFGRINPKHPHAWEMADQPLMLSRVFGGEGNRGPGLEVSWLTPLDWYVELVWSATMAAGEATARSFYGALDLGVKGPLDLQNTFAVKQFFPITDDLSLALGISAATGPNSTGRNRTDVYGVDMYLKYRPIAEASSTVLSLESEWIYRRRQVPGDLLSDFTGYVQGSWRFDPRWSAAARFELGTPAGGRAKEVIDVLDPEWTEVRDRTSLALTFYPTEFSRLRLQASADRPHWRQEPIFAAFLALEVGIGAHAAHPF